MSNTHELWGQIGAIFYLTHEEADTLRTLNSKTEPLFVSLVKERRYEINDQFYAPKFDSTDQRSPHMDNDIFIYLNKAVRRDNAIVTSMSPDVFQKMWCRMGVVLYLDDRQLQCLQQQDGAAADLVFDLINNNQYHVEGSCLFEDGIVEGYISPDYPLYIDLPPYKPGQENPMESKSHRMAVQVATESGEIGMPYKVHCHVPTIQYNQFYEKILMNPDEVIDFLFENRERYNPIRIFQAQDSGLFNCVLAVLDGHPQWGEYSLLQAARIREQELDCWPEIAADAGYKRVMLDQVDAYYARNRDEILESLWPEMPEVCEVVAILARENNPALFPAEGQAAADTAAESRETVKNTLSMQM